jgi:hypothetical protein
MPKMTGSRLFAEVCQGYGVTHVFFVPTILMDALAEADSLGIQKILTHGEKAAVYMADGYARARTRPAYVSPSRSARRISRRGLRDPFMAHYAAHRHHRRAAVRLAVSRCVPGGGGLRSVRRRAPSAICTSTS